MHTEEQLRVNLKSLPEGMSTVEAELNNDFFSRQEESEISGGSINVGMEINRHGDNFRTNIVLKGVVEIPCDRCLDIMQQDVSTSTLLLVRLGELPEECDIKVTQYSEDGETMIVEPTFGIADLSWFVYETIALSIPTRHIHAPGQCNDAMVERMEELAPSLDAARSSEESASDIDPRWNALKQLKIENK